MPRLPKNKKKPVTLGSEGIKRPGVTDSSKITDIINYSLTCIISDKSQLRYLLSKKTKSRNLATYY
ncbi:hypothetical protein HMPREF0083_00946 [Aneurinibacillus aneurinilyticus ATCC 12856]|uniref:Uncharacterized protein n=1 Tax=Aneurinibacillus aneurinilyticus ATCC 12856 TaxID=649747 RepID=U1YJI0_ANEAE|nr:hypothetical protein HMPREF0083_00946 [Aneurinibacillus aneurinilyticus ATCC 12856]